MVRFLALLIAGLTGAPAALADAYYNHNGSIMRLVEQGAVIRILYDQPHAGLSSAGVRPGALLFEGQMDAGLYLEGMTRLFSSRCGELDYYVYGQYRREGDFTLTGAAPVLETGGCRVIDNAYDSDDANLFFAWLRNDAPGPVHDAGRPDRGPLCVTGVSSSLNLRAGPGADYAVVGGLAAGACGVVAHDRCERGWCFVSQGRQIGWAADQYLRRP